MAFPFRGFAIALLAVLALQPVYLASLMALDAVAPAERRARYMVSELFLEKDKIWPADYAGGDWDAECAALAIGLEPGAGALRHAVAAARPSGLVVGISSCRALYAAATGAADIQWIAYPRYWHGYRVIVDPLTGWFYIGTVRLIMLALLVAALTWFAGESAALLGRAAAIALAAPAVVLTDFWHLWFVTSNSVATAAILAGAAWFARLLRRGADPGALLLGAAVLGSLFNFVDFLTNPPWQPALLAFLYVAASRDRGGRTLAGSGLVLAAWALGYGLTWASKWMIAAALLPDPAAALGDVAAVIRYRLDGDFGTVVDHHLLAPSAKVLSMLFWQNAKIPWAMALAMLTPALLAGPVKWRRFALLSLPALLPFVWFELLSNHSQIHAAIAYRPAAASIGILLAAFLLARPAEVSRAIPAG